MGVCLDCTLSYAHPLIPGGEDDVGNTNASITSPAYYSDILRAYGVQSALAKAKAPRMLRRWAAILGREPASIVEIGCGTGQYCEAWNELGVKWTGVEVNPQMLAFCRAKNMPVEQFDECLEGGRTYDVVFMSQVLEHIFEPYDFLKKVGRLLSDGGILHIDVPNHDSLTSLYRKANPFHRDYGFVQPMHHLIAYTRKSLAYLLQTSGFEVAEIAAYANDDGTFGQLVASKSLPARLYFRLSGVTGRGSLLVGIARKAARGNDGVME